MKVTESLDSVKWRIQCGRKADGFRKRNKRERERVRERGERSEERGAERRKGGLSIPAPAFAQLGSS